MMPDPNRQWFVYFKDKEMGPFSEVDLQSKLKSGELDGTAYVFTEGMSDWALVADTAIFAAKGPAVEAPTQTGVAHEAASAPEPDAKKAEAQSSQPIVKEQISTPKAQQKAEPTLQKAKVDTKAASSDKQASRTKMRRGFLYGTLVLVVLLAGMFYWADQGGYVPLLSDMLNLPQKIQPPPSPTPHATVVAGAANQDVGTGLGVPQKPLARFDWNELREFRKTEDPKGAPFRIASHALADLHPVIVGVLSPLVHAASVKVAIFPDAEKNLMPVAKVWALRATVVDGFFAIGPLNVEGAELPPGRYHLMAATGDVFLGEVTFDVGSWPAQDKLNEIQVQLQKDRAVLAERERTALELKYREVSGAIEQLKTKGHAATMGAKAAREWARASKAWTEAMGKAINDQRAVIAGPMFYGDAQKKLYNLMFETDRMQQALDLFSRRGPKALVRERKKSIGQLWTDLTALQSAVAGEIQILGQSAVGPLKQDPAEIKSQMMGEK